MLDVASRDHRVVSPLLGVILLLVMRGHAAGAEPKVPPAVKDFAIKDSSGKNRTAVDWKESKAVVLVFLGTECPVSNGYAPEISRLADKYAKRGVLFWGVHPDPEVTEAEATRHAREYRLLFPILLDPFHQLAAPTGVRVVPEAVLLEPGGKVRYRGRIDDKYTEDGKRRVEARIKDLENALEAMLGGKEVVPVETRAFGCPLPTPSKKPKVP